MDILHSFAIELQNSSQFQLLFSNWPAVLASENLLAVWGSSVCESARIPDVFLASSHRDTDSQAL